jgi:hypothetical protein
MTEERTRAISTLRELLRFRSENAASLAAFHHATIDDSLTDLANEDLLAIPNAKQTGQIW